jgi:glycosyltransferase involved in cell wall biosynthesis
MERDTLPLVTIAIPTYNRAGSFLPVALRSAFSQSYPRLEVLVADNASTDETPALLQSVTDKRVRYIRHQVNIGANRNYNHCLREARGDYFLLLHDDDAIDEDFAAVCMAAADYRVYDGVIRTGVRVIDERGSTVREIPNAVGDATLAQFFLAWFAGKTCWYLANTLFSTRELRAAGGFHSRYGLAEDGFAIAQLARSHRVDVGPVKASFRVHRAGNTMADPTHALLWGREYRDLLDCICALVAAEEAPALRREGMRFFAKLAYNRAALTRSPTRRLWAYFEVLRLFEYCCWPTHRLRSLRLIRQARGYIRHRLEKIWLDSNRLGHSRSEHM